MPVTANLAARGVDNPAGVKLDYAGVVLVDDPPSTCDGDVAERQASRGHCADRCRHFESKATVRPMLVVMPT